MRTMGSFWEYLYGYLKNSRSSWTWTWTCKISNVSVTVLLLNLFLVFETYDYILRIKCKFTKFEEEMLAWF